VVQEKIEQSELINAFNKDSINTVRVSLYKDKDNVVHMLNSGIRIGKDGSLDNVSDGGIVCSIKLNGMLNEYATDIDEKKYLSHPNSGFVFEGESLPLYEDLVEASKSIARSVIGARIISLDMALDSTDRWRCIEINLFGQTIRIPQNAGESFLGEYTDEIINDLIKSKR
ncbi:sugar-transfer associated ATP-grasp domain-containing protein, partial [Psychrobacter sp. 1U2]